jgi:hypothetical protein
MKPTQSSQDWQFLGFTASPKIVAIIRAEAEQQHAAGKTKYPNWANAIRRLIRRADRLAKEKQAKGTVPKK